MPAVSYPADLPVTQAREEIAAALREHQVVVLAGETGSGKTTQLPKILLELGRGVTGMIGHTQPRRIAARTVAERVAEELRVEVGAQVGYAVRFSDQSSPDTLVRVMTDGLLLAELRSDPELRRYDTIVVDEAHERSLTIDVLLGYLAQLLPRRPDLSVVITSATIDTERFAAHFGGAPVLRVGGRTYPVETRYRPPQDAGEQGEPLDQPQAITQAVLELCAEGPGDVLVFLAGEREIRDAAEVLRGSLPPTTEVLPLYSRLSAAEQHKVFAPHQQRRVVLATNVAETSLTVPGIRYVVDPGDARVSRYSQRLKVQRLPIEPVSRASADQRAGRCGRLGPGVCIRLYSEEDYLARPEHTDPEILRTSLASVVLLMATLGLGDVETFPFLDPPDRRAVKDARDLLHELGALDLLARDPRRALTPTGRLMARLPVDPRMARMIVEADRLGCLPEVLVVVSALSIQDVRERPSDAQQAADEMHRRFADPTSDFLATIRLWDHLRELRRELSSSALRRRMRQEHLHHQRWREWQDLHSQLRSTCRELGLGLQTPPADPDRIHQAVLAGLLSHVGLREGERRDYLGARGARFSVVRDSGVAPAQPRWVMAAELVETNRLWARRVARVQPEWVESLAGHLVVRVYSEPHWSVKRAGVSAFERVTLYGIPLVTKRRVDYGAVDPVVSRDLFLRHALVQGEWTTHHRFWADNQALLDELRSLEERARRRDLVVSDDVLYAFYDARVPAEVVSGRHFDAWWKAARRDRPDLLTMTPELLRAGADVVADDFPTTWSSGDLDLSLAYAFEPGSDLDGVAVDVPLEVLNRVREEDFQWHVPGTRADLVTALLRSLPKPLRVRVGPAPDAAREVLALVDPASDEILPGLERALRQVRGVDVPRDAWDWAKVPAHLRPRFRVVDADGAVLAEGRDLAALQQRLTPRVQAVLTEALAPAAAVPGLPTTGAVTGFPSTPLPVEVAEGRVRGFPALVEEGTRVALRVLPTRAEADRAHHSGVRRLLRSEVPSPVRAASDRLTTAQKLALARSPYPSVQALLEDVVVAALDGLVTPVREPADYAALRERARAELGAHVTRALLSVERVLQAHQRLGAALEAEQRPALQGVVRDLRAHAQALVGPGFVGRAGLRRLPDLERYLAADLVRLQRAPRDVARDAALQERLEWLVGEVTKGLAGLTRAAAATDEAAELPWMLEEFRLSLSDPGVRTRYPVSEKRVLAVLDALRDA